jgi:hypothetical protein
MVRRLEAGIPDKYKINLVMKKKSNIKNYCEMGVSIWQNREFMIPI